MPNDRPELAPIIDAIKERRSFHVEVSYADLRGTDELRSLLFIRHDASANQWRVGQVQVFEQGSDTPFVGADG